jgi:hypothetical protein
MMLEVGLKPFSILIFQGWLLDYRSIKRQVGLAVLTIL